MSKSEQIREALRSGGGNTQEIADRAGVDANFVSTVLGQLATKGEVIRSGEKGAYTFAVNPDYTRGRKGQQQRKSSKAPTSDRKKIREIAKKARAPSASEFIEGLAATSVLAQARHLAATVRAEVDEIESAPALLHALTSFEMADSIHQAAKGLS